MAVENAKVDVPDVMVERQLDSTMQTINMSLSYQGMNLETYLGMMGMDEKTMRDNYRENALADVKAQLILEKISLIENIEASDEELEEEISQMAANFNQKAEDFKKHLQDSDIEYIKETVITNKTINLMKAQKAESSEE